MMWPTEDAIKAAIEESNVWNRNTIIHLRMQRDQLLEENESLKKQLQGPSLLTECPRCGGSRATYSKLGLQTCDKCGLPYLFWEEWAGMNKALISAQIQAQWKPGGCY